MGRSWTETMISNTLWFCDFCHTLYNNIYVDVSLLVVHDFLKPKTVWYREFTQQICLDKWSFQLLHAKTMFSIISKALPLINLYSCQIEGWHQRMKGHYHSRTLYQLHSIQSHELPGRHPPRNTEISIDVTYTT